MDNFVMECEAIQFIDTAEAFVQILELVREEAFVDYSTGKPVLKFGQFEFNEGEYVVKTPYGVVKGITSSYEKYTG